jgi:hypothetical protein
MPVSRIEKCDASGKTVQRVERHRDGRYHCYHFGDNANPIHFATLDDVAEFLRKNSKAGVRMNPGWSKISKRIYIDGAPR